MTSPRQSPDSHRTVAPALPCDPDAEPETPREPETVQAFGCSLPRAYPATWRTEGPSGTSIVVRQYPATSAGGAAYSVSVYQGPTVLAAAEGETIEDAEAACAMRLSFVVDAIRQVLNHADGGRAARVRGERG